MRAATGFAAVADQDQDSAIPHLWAAYDLSGHNVTIGNALSIALKIARRQDDFLRVAKELALRNPYNAEQQVVWAMALMNEQRYHEAYAVLSPLRDVCLYSEGQGAASTLRQIGKCEMYLGRHEDAIESLRRSDALYGGAALVQAYLGEALLKMGSTEAAGKILDKALVNNPELPQALYYRGVLAEMADDQQAQSYFAQAVEYGERGLATASDNGTDYFLLYLACIKVGNHRKADQYRRSAAELRVTRMAPWAPNATVR